MANTEQGILNVEYTVDRGPWTVDLLRMKLNNPTVIPDLVRDDI